MPESSLQYEFVNSVANRQIMIVSMLQMCFNEYLSMQGEYLDSLEASDSWDADNWHTEENLTYTNNAGVVSAISYDFCKDEYVKIIEKNLNRANILMEADIDINTTAYTGISTPVTLNFDTYMKPEDATSVSLKLDNYSSSHNYYNELDDNGFLDYSDNVTKYITSSANIYEYNTFRRVQMGANGKVYYILNSTPNLSDLAHNIKRFGPTGIDGTVGDLQVASSDYLNVIKTMSDGTNTYSVPADVNESLSNLFKSPTFGALYQYKPADYLASYLPENTTGSTYLLTSQYNNRLTSGTTNDRSGWLKLSNLTAGADNLGQLSIEQKDFDPLLTDSNNKYAVIVAPREDTYRQKVTLDLDSVISGVTDAYIVSSDGNITDGNSTTFVPGEDVTIKFKLQSPKAFNYIKMIRYNLNETATICVDKKDFETAFEADSDGYYSFTIPMPYSEIEIVISATGYKVMEEDEEGRFIIRTYEDLKNFATNVNFGIEEFVYGDYILANDIECGVYSPWTTPIGYDKSAFKGTFDGQGYELSNFQFDEGAYYYIGLFGCAENATIKNLKVKLYNDLWWDILGDDELYFGTICAKMRSGSTISNCFVSSTEKYPVIKETANAGGICGYAAEDTLIEKSINTAIVQIDQSAGVGAIVGYTNGTVKNCGNLGTIHTCARSVGVIAGKTGTEAIISNCYSCTLIFDQIVGNYNAGAICGSGSEGQISNCYLSDNPEYFKDGSIAYLLQGNQEEKVWGQKIGTDTYPTLYAPRVYLENDTYINKTEVCAYDTASKNITVYFNSPGSYTVVCADYEGKRLSQVAHIPAESDSAGNITIPTTLELGSGDKIMLWNNLTEIAPVCEEFVVR